MEKGYAVFGNAYEAIFRNDLHDEGAVDHYILRDMILLEKDSKAFIYQMPHLLTEDIIFHELYDF